ncbi:MAG TPA: LysE family transporter [Bacillota bacterium]|nr:LysE family transporter [Bacillota bacterium]
MPFRSGNPSAIAVLLAALGVGLSGALMPGPLTVVVLHQAMRLGTAAGLLAGSAHALLEFFMVLALGVGLGRLLNRPAVAGGVALAGGLAMLAISWQMVMAPPPLPPAVQPGPGLIPSGALLGGAVATLGNPYWFVWWATVGASQIAWAGRRHRLIFWLGHITADLAWLTVLAVAVSRGRNLLGGPAYSLLLQGLGAAVAVLGLYFVLSARRLARGRGPTGNPTRKESTGQRGRKLGR